MLFNSVEFLIFLPAVFILYWFIVNKNLRLQNSFLLVASYVFYGWWDWRFLFLLAGVGLFNYMAGIALSEAGTPGKKRAWMLAGVAINVVTLCVFKYFNFFIDSFTQLFSSIGYELPRSSTRIVLPIGISFYIFLSLSYIIDIYKEKMQASKNIIDVLLCLSFFPIVLAGPIQRPITLLPQVSEKREFNYASAIDGLRQILWGLFKKIVLADTCAANADYIFANHATLNGSVLVMGVIFFAFQIYGDFSGYSDIAIGIGRLFGFNLMRNFAFPYFASNIAMFWQRWHISLTTWFRDYIFLPLSFSMTGNIRGEKVFFMKSDLYIYMVASAVTWFLTGLWHGANFTFIIWGLIHGAFLVIYQWQKVPRKNLLKKAGIRHDHVAIVAAETFLTLAIVGFAWIFFKSDSIKEAFGYIHNIYANGLFTISILDLRGRGITSTLIDGSIAIFVVLIIEWIQRNKQHGLEIDNYPLILRWSIYWSVTFFCLIFLGHERTFIYFQF
jgi:D-alanyl-lipoteichoic acid acyltransferase DltB (MBOAT superfamily)